MALVVFEQADGKRVQVAIGRGQSLMGAALYGGVDGIDADCGGQLACATCHVVVAADWLDRLPAPDPDEVEMLGFAVGVEAGSRLSCQIRLDDSLDGLTVNVPARQR